MKIIKHFIFKSNVSFYDKILSTVKETYADYTNIEELTTQNHQNRPTTIFMLTWAQTYWMLSKLTRTEYNSFQINV